MDNDINEDIKKQIKELQETLLSIKTTVEIPKSSIQQIQQKLDKLFNKINKDEDKN